MRLQTRQKILNGIIRRRLKKIKNFLKYAEKQLTKPTVSNIIILNT